MSDEPICPECGSEDVVQTGDADEEGLAEYMCYECGHYFVAWAQE